MKKLFLVIFTTLVSSLFLFANDVVESRYDIEAFKNLQIIIHQDGLINSGKYEFTSGEKLSSKDLKESLMIVPENQKILKESTAWQITNYAMLGTMLTSLGVMTACSFSDNDDLRKIAYPSASIVFLSSFLVGTLANNIASVKRNKAVDNYNLYIMGVPIK